ncbi:MAG: hypothetical protein WC943_14600 [Elusimicrobiota bacterium]|jgi:hypothetical protein
MRTLIIFALLAVGGYYGYQASMAKPEAMVVYEKFEGWLSNGNCGEMRNLVEDGSQARERVDMLCRGKSSAAGLIADMNSTPSAAMRTTVYKLLKVTKSASGNEVSLEIRESVRGRGSAMNPLPAPRTYTVKARKSGASWKLVELPQ